MATKKIPAVLRLNDKSYSIPTLHVEVPADFEIEDILVPGAWAHHAAKLRAGYEIIARRVDLAWRAHLQVTEVGIGFVTVHVLNRWENPEHKAAPAAEPDGDLPDLPENYKVVFAPKSGWVVRTIDPPATVDTKPTKVAAHMAAIKHASKALGAAA